jgi:hypothetical protein
MRKAAWLAAAVGLLAAQGSADVWDVSMPNDDTIVNTPNFLIHGVRQVHDLEVRPGPVADEDWYMVYTLPYSSYEFLQDGTTGGTVFPASLTVERHDVAGTLLQSGHHLGNQLNWADAVTLAWENATNSTQFDLVRVTSPACGISCTSNEQYAVRFYDTTYAIPRFNNTGGQSTVLIMQNLNTVLTGEPPIHGHVYFWSASGSLLATRTFSLSALETLVLNTASVPGAGGAAGAITVSNDGRYGQLSGKAVALDPATGFSFDSPMTPKPH